MTDRQNKMLSEMKRGIADALDLIEQTEDLQAVYDTAQDVKANYYIGRIYQLAHIATIETIYEKNGYN